MSLVNITRDRRQVVIATLDGGGAPFRVAATEVGVVAAGWEADEAAFIEEVVARLHLPTVRLAEAEPDDAAAAVLRAAIQTIEALLKGRPADGAAIDIDLADRPSFDQRVLGEVRRVGWGETASYGDIAKRVGMPRAARAVGGALGRNPISLLIPCHRIIAGDGTLGGYGGTGWLDRDRQRSRKEALLLREGVTVPRRDG
jgi:O-6-methylguanine DNA methyltransferase